MHSTDLHSPCVCTHIGRGREIIQRDVRQHLVVRAFVSFCQHQIVVNQQDLAKGARLPHLDVLVGCPHVFEQRLGVKRERHAKVLIALLVQSPGGVGRADPWQQDRQQRRSGSSRHSQRKQCGCRAHRKAQPASVHTYERGEGAGREMRPNRPRDPSDTQREAAPRRPGRRRGDVPPISTFTT